MKRIFSFLIVVMGSIFGATTISANQIGEGMMQEILLQEAGTNPPPHHEGQEEFGEEYNEILKKGILEHRVADGDTLWKISNYYGANFDEVVEINNQFEDPNMIYPDDVVYVPVHKRYVE